MEDQKKLVENLDKMREDFEYLKDAWIEQTRAENIVLAEMLHLLWAISGQGVGARTVLSELGRDISPGVQAKANRAWVNAQKRINLASECSQVLDAELREVCDGADKA